MAAHSLRYHRPFVQADYNSNNVRRVYSNGTILPYAGIMAPAQGNAYTGNGGLAVAAKLNSPEGMALDCFGGL